MSPGGTALPTAIARQLLLYQLLRTKRKEKKMETGGYICPSPFFYFLFFFSISLEIFNGRHLCAPTQLRLWSIILATARPPSYFDHKGPDSLLSSNSTQEPFVYSFFLSLYFSFSHITPIGHCIYTTFTKHFCCQVCFFLLFSFLHVMG